MGHDPRTRRLALALLAALGACALFATGASADLLTPESGGSPNADEIDSLYKIVLAIAAVVFVGVEGALVYSLFKFRSRKGAVASQIRGNNRLEFAWTIIPAIVLIVLAVVTFVQLGDIRDPSDSDADGLQLADGVLVANTTKRLPPNGKALQMKVNGQQYVWRYTYPDGDDNLLNNAFAYGQMVVPTGTSVTLEIEAQDVAHSWWIPALGGKFDAVPGHTNHTWFKISKPGVYRGQCAELCGRNHANMTASVRAVAPAEFEAWLAQRKRDIKDSNSQAQRQRKQFEGAAEEQGA